MLLERLFGERRGENLTTLADPAKWLLDWIHGGVTSTSGEPVSVSSAEGLPAAYRCRQLLAWSVAQLPLKLMELLEEGDKQEARDEPLYRLLHDQPNLEMTPFDFWSHQMDSLTGWGNAYAEIQRSTRGDVLNLWPLSPVRMTVDRDGLNRLRYQYRQADGTPKTWLFDWRNPPIWHLRINSLDGIHGRSPVELHRETIGRAIAVGKFGARFFKNSATPRGALSVPGNLTPDQRATLRTKLEEAHSGENAHRPMVLEGGIKWESIGLQNDEAQFIETMKMSRTDVAMIYGVPPHMIGDTEKSTSWGSGIEQQGIGFVTYTLNPYLVAIEQSVPLYLLNTQQARRYRAEFVREALLRGDIKSRYEAYQIARQNGILNANEWRRRDNLNRIEGAEGDERWRPANMVVAGARALPPPPAA